MSRGIWANGKPSGTMVRVNSTGEAYSSEWSGGVEVGSEQSLVGDEAREFTSALREDASKSVSDVFEAVRHRFEYCSQVGLLDPVYSHSNQFLAQSALASALIEAAGRVLSEVAEENPAGAQAALALICDAYKVVLFAQGFTSGGLTRTEVVLRNGAVETWQGVVEFARDPKQTVDAILHLYEAVSSPDFTKAVGGFLQAKWAEFATASAFKQGDMARTLVDQLVVEAAKGVGLGIVARGVGKATGLADALRQLSRVAQAKSGGFLSAKLSFVAEGRRRGGAVELMAQGNIVDVASSAQYELLKAELRVRQLFTASGGLTESALANSIEVVHGADLADGRVIAELTAGWLKHFGLEQVLNASLWNSRP